MVSSDDAALRALYSSGGAGAALFAAERTRLGMVRVAPTLDGCSQCGGARFASLFCTTCGVLNSRADAGIAQATRGRQLAVGLIDTILLAGTLIVGWAIILLFTARNSQTPGSSLLGLYIFDESGQPSSARRVLLRGISEIAISVGFGLVTAGVATVANQLWIFRYRNRQTLHDLAAETIMVSVSDRAVLAAPGTRPTSTRGTGPRGCGSRAPKAAACGAGHRDSKPRGRSAQRRALCLLPVRPSDRSHPLLRWLRCAQLRAPRGGLSPRQSSSSRCRTDRPRDHHRDARRRLARPAQLHRAQLRDPGGQIAGLRVYRLDGQPASRARVNARGLYELLIGLGLGLPTAGVVTLIDYFCVLRGDNRQSLHDVAAKTILVRVENA